ncbi:sigma-70 family RNA polymerase sigma factor [Acutalibacter intestini]|uniref:sigma-70 family RNA polymerase sigma factor n=1 Tax=Acutalibacter intestini TaxID=3093659 RepID=UPI002AC969BA|nr:sigma-70 family RNA polymerase sigma factor [Acutalibacter sp. M00204]
MAEDFGSLSDIQLVQLVGQGEPEAFVELSARYLWLLQEKARQFSGLEHEDLVQEGFLALYAAALSYREGGGASFSTYAGVCVFNRMAKAARRHGSPGNRTLNESLSLDSAGNLPAGAGPQDLLELREGFAAMRQRIDQALTPLERQALALYLGGYKREEIPGRSGMTLKAFDNALYRARVKLSQLKGQR